MLNDDDPDSSFATRKKKFDGVDTSSNAAQKVLAESSSRKREMNPRHDKPRQTTISRKPPRPALRAT
jgi:hypothetical protein